MDQIRLVQPDAKYKNEYLGFIASSKADIEERGMGYYLPFSDEQSFARDVEQLQKNGRGIGLPEGWVPASTYWLIDEERMLMLGAITLRHWITGYLLFRGGHISYYVRPSERQKGYATKMLGLCLEKCRELKLEKVMITCAKANIGSAKTIQNNGGMLYSEDVEDGEAFQRYWITL